MNDKPLLLVTIALLWVACLPLVVILVRYRVAMRADREQRRLAAEERPDLLDIAAERS